LTVEEYLLTPGDVMEGRRFQEILNLTTDARVFRTGANIAFALIVQFSREGPDLGRPPSRKIAQDPRMAASS